MVQKTYGEDVDIGALILRLWSGKWWIIVGAIVSATIFTAVAFLMQPTYRASAVLLPVSADGSGLQGGIASALGSLGGLASLAGISLDASNDTEQEALAVLKSREFLEKFVKERDLMPVLFEDDWDRDRKTWKDEADPPTLARAHKYFVEDVLSVVDDGNSSLVTLHIDWHDREVAASWANDLIVRLNAEMRDRALQQADASLRFLEAELKVTSQVAIQEAINRLVEAQIGKRMLANVTQEYAFRIVDRAMPPDEDDPLRPSKPMFLILGGLLGVIVGALMVLIALPDADGRKSTDIVNNP